MAGIETDVEELTEAELLAYLDLILAILATTYEPEPA